jgi:hypothetical protein
MHYHDRTNKKVGYFWLYMQTLPCKHHKKEKTKMGTIEHKETPHKPNGVEITETILLPKDQWVVEDRQS